MWTDRHKYVGLSEKWMICGIIRFSPNVLLLLKSQTQLRSGNLIWRYRTNLKTILKGGAVKRHADSDCKVGIIVVVDLNLRHLIGQDLSY